MIALITNNFSQTELLFVHSKYYSQIFNAFWINWKWSIFKNENFLQFILQVLNFLANLIKLFWMKWGITRILLNNFCKSLKNVEMIFTKRHCIWHSFYYIFNALSLIWEKVMERCFEFLEKVFEIGFDIFRKSIKLLNFRNLFLNFEFILKHWFKETKITLIKQIQSSFE